MITKRVFESVLVLTLLLSLFSSCDKNNSSETAPLNDSEKHSLLFMLEEEKLARDTYTFLDAKWANTPFDKIKDSEQTHMDAIKSLLDAKGIAYNILAEGQFADTVLQKYYNQFVIDGAISLSKALAIGATIEDLDIVDLRNYSKETVNQSVIDVFNKLECGSRNHLRSFFKSITAIGETYNPQFLSISDFNDIVTSDSEKCN